jgi:hypothetical protein
MNSNLFHNILNIIMALTAVALLPEIQAILPPEIAVAVASGAATLKLVINVVRDGITGLAKEQPPVK